MTDMKVTRSAIRYPDRHDDMFGTVSSALSGGTAWQVQVITGTPFYAGTLRNNSSDLVQVAIQVPHTRKLTTNLDSIHIHYVLQAASGLNETIVFTGSYCWLQIGDAVPATVGWTTMSSALTLNLGAVKPIRYYGIHAIETNIPCPAGVNEGYGGMLLIQIVRGNGSYAGNLAIMAVDSHSIMNRNGSLTEYTE